MYFTSQTRPELPKLEAHGLNSAHIHVSFGPHNVFEEFELVASIKKNQEMVYSKNLTSLNKLEALTKLGQHSRMVPISWSCVLMILSG